MCGLAGILRHSNHVTPPEIQDMVARLPHRGPDDQGIWTEKHIGLGHARLSIHDLSASGHQPMASHCGRWVMVFNGEIYNYRTLRQNLYEERQGLQFAGDSDTEVLVNAIAHWGIEKTLKKAIGMFAFACWDRDQGKLFLARDRFGEKPLYYGQLGHDFVFGSELRVFQTQYRDQLTIAKDALASYLRYGYVPTPYSIFKGIFKLEPATILECDERLNTKQYRYWSRVDVALCGYGKTREDVSLTGATDELETLLKQVLADQMLADVPLGAFLSGGIDSSSIVALMQSLSSQPIKTFSIGFDNPQFDEAPYAKAVAQHLQTEHTELYVTGAQALEVVPLLPNIYDEPFADSSQIPTFLVSQLAREHVTVSLSGDAGDELFGGYNRYLYANQIKQKLLDKPFVAALVKHFPVVLLKFADYLPQKKVAFLANKISKIQNALRASGGSFPQFYESICSQNLFPEQLLLSSGEVKPLEEHRYIQLLDQLDPISWMMLIDACTYMQDDILVKVDRAAMAVSLETRVPFLDHRVYEWAWQLPQHYKISQGQGKQILREMLYRYVPRKLIERPKRGFGIPLGSWLRAELKVWAEDLLDPQKLVQQGLFNSSVVQALWQRHQSGREDLSAALWTILMFQAWYAEWVKP